MKKGILALCMGLLCFASPAAKAEDEGDFGTEAAQELNEAIQDAGEQMPDVPFGPGSDAIEEVTESNQQEFGWSDSSDE